MIFVTSTLPLRAARYSIVSRASSMQSIQSKQFTQSVLLFDIQIKVTVISQTAIRTICCLVSSLSSVSHPRTLSVFCRMALINLSKRIHYLSLHHMLQFYSLLYQTSVFGLHILVIRQELSSFLYSYNLKIKALRPFET
jgi:hypothetical protein